MAARRKIHALVDAEGRPILVTLTFLGQAHDGTAAKGLLSVLKPGNLSRLINWGGCGRRAHWQRLRSSPGSGRSAMGDGPPVPEQ
ncbi:hypothetical protein [Microvirga vignae]|uniref:hypothetical protein n=1 Tax=Microvirga vignae TaxID=1225564 RepID=UPI00123770A9